MPYDIVGDIHGERTTLEALLEKLGYRSGTSGWSHPSRTAVFVGDFIDRGPDSRGTCRLVRDMTEAGHALAVMGNHELNALAFHGANPQAPGEPLRPHTEKNVRQHQATLTSFEGADAEFADTLEWFTTLPLWLDLDDLRIVHAAWDASAMATLEPLLDGQRRIEDGTLPLLTLPGHPAFAAAETLLKGVELPLPEGVSFSDKDGQQRQDVRIRWWLSDADPSWRNLALGPDALLDQLPDGSVAAARAFGYPAEAAPVLFGHYWLTGAPAPLAANVACLDYSVARPGGKLAAYRWHGESRLRADDFVTVARIQQSGLP